MKTLNHQTGNNVDVKMVRHLEIEKCLANRLEIEDEVKRKSKNDS